MFGFLYSWFVVLIGLWISGTKTQTLPNSRIPDTYGEDRRTKSVGTSFKPFLYITRVSSTSFKPSILYPSRSGEVHSPLPPSRSRLWSRSWQVNLGEKISSSRTRDLSLTPSLSHLGASIDDVRVRTEGEGIQRYPLFTDKQYITIADREGKGVTKSKYFFRRHIWKPCDFLHLVIIPSILCIAAASATFLHCKWMVPSPFTGFEAKTNLQSANVIWSRKKFVLRSPCFFDLDWGKREIAF